MRYAIGIDLGGSSVKAVAVTAKGKSLWQSNEPFDSESSKEWLERIKAAVNQIQADQGTLATWIGLAAPGLASKDSRSIACMPGRLHGLEGLDWTKALGRNLPVPVLNDAHSALSGEAWLGAARGFSNVIMLTLGTGVGGAAIVDGRLLRGEIGRAGHLGHISLDPDGLPDFCRTPGSLEVAIGNYNIRERSRGRFESTHQLVHAYRAGDQEAAVVWEKSVGQLARAIVSFVNILDPKAVIIGGGIARSGRALFGPLRKLIDEFEWRPGGHRVKLLRARMGEFAGAYGAAHHSIVSSRRG